MASTPPPPQPTAAREYDSAWENIFPIKQFKTFRKFLKTRAAVIRGDTLYADTKSGLSALGLMGPWEFNFTQSTICSLPGSLATGLTAILSSHQPPIQAADPIKAKVISALSPFLPPYTLLLLVFAVAFCSLPSGFVTKEGWVAAQRKYLYLDGAFGMWPQFILATCFAVSGMSPSFHFPAWISLVTGLIFFGTFIWQAIITAFKLREGMFDYDYLPEEETMFGSLKERPLFKFYIVLVLATPTVFVVCGLVVGGFASLVSAIVHHL